MMATKTAMLTRHYVVTRRQWTQSTVGTPTEYPTKDEAYKAAEGYNRTNQDDTWNAVRAYYQNGHACP